MDVNEEIVKMQKSRGGGGSGRGLGGGGGWPGDVRVDRDQELVTVKMHKKSGGWSGWM